MLLLVAALLLTGTFQDGTGRPTPEASKDALTSAAPLTDSNPETLEELLSQNRGVLEGDILLADDRNVVGQLWGTRDIPYTISPELESRTGDIVSALAMVSEQTCVSFHKRTTEENYLFFKKSKGCASYVGFIGGEQAVYIAPQCIVGNIIHEVLHALGFHHEHTRKDREQYITIVHHNILEGKESNFHKIEGETFSLPYDLSSIMHYGRSFFSSNGLPTIVPKVEANKMGQRVKMTSLDVDRVRQLFNCDATENPSQVENGVASKEADAKTPVLMSEDTLRTSGGHQSPGPAGKPAQHRNSTVSVGH